MKRSKRPKPGSLSAGEQDTYRRALDAIRLMREHRRYSLSRAARESGTSARSVKRYASSALQMRRRRHRAKDSDRLRRSIIFYNERGQFTLVTRSSRQASQIARYHNAVRAFLIHGDDSALKAFDGKSIVVDSVSYPYLTDRRALMRLARAGELNILEIYKD